MDWLKKLENIKKFYQDPGFVYPEARPTEPKSVQYQEYLKMEPYLEPSSQMFVRDRMGFEKGDRVLSPTIQARQEFKGKKFISVPDPTYSDGRRRVMTPEYKKYVEELRAKASPAEQRTIKAYNTAKEKLGRIPSIEEVRAAAPGKSKPALSVVRKFLEKNNLELSKPRGGLKEAILKSHTDLTKELGRPPRVAEIDEQTKNLSKMKNPDGRKSVISEYLNEAKLKYSPALFKTDPKVRAEVRAKGAATLRAKDKPRLGQPRKTPEDILQRERYKRMEDAKRDPKRIKRAISDVTDTSLDVHHPFPKREKETLRKLMLLDKDVNRKGVVREVEEARNALIREQNILLNRPVRNERRLQQINALMRKLQERLRKTGYGGYLGFPISEPGKRKPRYVGFDKSKSLAGLREGEKLLDKDFAKATKGQKSRMVVLAQGLNKILDCKLADGVNCDDPMSYYKSLKEQEKIAATGKGANKLKAVSKVRAAKNLLYGTIGPAAVAIEAGIAAPLAGYEFFQGALPSEILNTATYGIAGKDRDEVIQEASSEEIFKPRDFMETGDLIQSLYSDPITGGWRGRYDRIGAIEDAEQKFKDLYYDPYFAHPKTGDFSESIFQLRQKQQQAEEDKYQKQRDQLKQQRADKYTNFSSGLELPEFAGGGIARVRRPNAIAPESGPAPQGEGLSYLFNRVREW